MGREGGRIAHRTASQETCRRPTNPNSRAGCPGGGATWLLTIRFRCLRRPGPALRTPRLPGSVPAEAFMRSDSTVVSTQQTPREPDVQTQGAPLPRPQIAPQALFLCDPDLMLRDALCRPTHFRPSWRAEDVMAAWMRALPDTMAAALAICLLAPVYRQLLDCPGSREGRRLSALLLSLVPEEPTRRTRRRRHAPCPRKPSAVPLE